MQEHRWPAPAAEEASLAVRVPAKVNLFLSVRGRRDDGLHEVVTVLQTVDIHDRVVGAVRGSPATLNHPAARKLMEVTFDHTGIPSLPADGSNIVVQAANLLRDRFGRRNSVDTCGGQLLPVTHLHLRKLIPVGAGMAGGSADAAATLVLLNELWGLELDRDELCGIAAELGADVPFCVMGGTAVGTGTGRTVTPVLCRGQFHWVVCIGDRPLSTAEVYRTWDDVGTPGAEEPEAVLEALSEGDAGALSAALHNDLEVPAFRLRPGLRSLQQRLVRCGALGTVLSGSGATMVALAASATHAQAIADEVRDLVPRVEVARSPAGGPQVVPADPDACG